MTLTPIGPRAGADRSRQRRGWPSFLRDVLLILLAALLISFLIKTFLVRSFYIPSDSMNVTLVQNDRVLVNELVPGLAPLDRGDVVVFRDPGNWLDAPSAPPSNGPGGLVDGALTFVGLAPDKNNHLIKRVIGLPGDTVACCTVSGQLTINGTALTEPYITLRPGAATATPDRFDVTVPDGDLWLLGDNRYNSEDSAYHRNEASGGFVPISDVVGRAMVISWPFDRWGTLDNFPETFSGVTSK
jgi:signal peptidase I